MNLTTHFTLEEMTFTSVRLDNTCPPELLPELTATARMLESVRAYLGQIKGEDVAIRVTSAYRSLPVNRAIGSKDNSDHPKAMAADVQAPDFGTPLAVARVLEPVMAELGIGQLIHEFGRWVHVSTRSPDRDVNDVLSISAAGTGVGLEAVA